MLKLLVSKQYSHKAYTLQVWRFTVFFCTWRNLVEPFPEVKRIPSGLILRGRRRELWLLYKPA
jgi:hypothetical protein